MCSNPIKLQREDGTVFFAKCGHCLHCLKEKQDAICLRLDEECKSLINYKSDGQLPAVFFTLTYRDEDIPKRYLVLTTAGYYVSWQRPSLPDDRILVHHRSLSGDFCMSDKAWDVHCWRNRFIWNSYVRLLLGSKFVFEGYDRFCPGFSDFHPVSNIEDFHRFAISHANHLARRVSYCISHDTSDSDLFAEYVERKGKSVFTVAHPRGTVRRMDIFHPYLLSGFATPNLARELPDDIVDGFPFHRATSSETRLLEVFLHNAPGTYSSVVTGERVFPSSKDVDDIDDLLASFGVDDVDDLSSYFDDLPENFLPEFMPQPLVAIEFTSANNDDITKWIKRGRRNFERKVAPSLLKVNSDGVSFNPRFCQDWLDKSGCIHPMPSCYTTKNFHHFVTSEYGPRTSRPHYHGIVFGLTLQEFWSCLGTDWTRRFGTVDAETLDPARGAAHYCGKYVTKGVYETPYLQKHFFYTHKDGSESTYYSPVFERLYDDFSIDGSISPLIGCTWKYSQGLGCRYAFTSEIQRLFHVSMVRSIREDNKVSYFSVTDDDVASIMPSCGLDPFISFRPAVNPITGEYGFALASKYKTLDVKCLSEVEVLVRRLDSAGRLVNESVVRLDSTPDVSFENDFLKIGGIRKFFKYSRINGQKVKTPTIYQIPLPRYFSRWLVPPLSSFLRQSAIQRIPDPVNFFDPHGKFEPIRPDGCADQEALPSSKVSNPREVAERIRETSFVRNFRVFGNVLYGPKRSDFTEFE